MENWVQVGTREPRGRHHRNVVNRTFHAIAPAVTSIHSNKVYIFFIPTVKMCSRSFFGDVDQSIVIKKNGNEIFVDDIKTEWLIILNMTSYLWFPLNEYLRFPELIWQNTLGVGTWRSINWMPHHNRINAAQNACVSLLLKMMSIKL